MMGESTARLGGGSYISVRWADLRHPKPVETRSADEIKNHMKNVLAGLGEGEK